MPVFAAARALTKNQKLRTGASIGIDAGFAALDYKNFRKDGYGKGGAFATAATYAGVGAASAVATKGIRKWYYAIPANIAVAAAGNYVISRRVEKHFNPRNRPKAVYYRRQGGKMVRVRNGRKRQTRRR